jgi:DNA-binding SARP family transcriptional activator
MPSSPRRGSADPVVQAWRLRLQGLACIEGPAGQRIALERRAAALLALAALEPGVPRERVARWLWPDSADPRHNLRQQLLRFKRQFGVALVVGDTLLSLADGVTLVDDTALPLLADLDYDDCDDFAAWLQAANGDRQAAALRQLADELASAEQAGELGTARQLAERWRLLEPASEAAHRALMQVHYLRGDAAAGLSVYAELQAMLARGPGGAPGAETQALAASLRSSTRPVARVAAAVPHSLQRPPRLVGRQRELAAVAAGWASTPVVWLLGEAGMGKSRLIDELLRAEGTGNTPRVLQAQARPGDQGVPYATLARLLRQALAGPHAPIDDAGRLQLARVLPELAPAVPLPADGQRLMLQAAVQQIIAHSGAGLLVLDDLHFADDATLDAGRAIGPPAPGRARWLLAQRPAEGRLAATTLRDALHDDCRHAWCRCSALDEAATAELVDSLGLDGVHGHDLAAELVRHTGGNPLYLLETLKSRQLQGGAAGRMPQPASVGALIERRLRQLSPAALALARVAALAGDDFDVELAEAVLGSSTLALTEPWAELEAAQVLREQRFAHDLVFEATLRTVPTVVAARLHGQLAAHLEGRGAEPAHIAAHWLAARQGLKAVPWLVTAGERALARFQRGAAGEHHWAAALELLAAGDRDAAFHQFYRCAEAWSELSDLPRLEALREQLMQLAGNDAQWARAHLAAARVHDFRGDYPALGQASERVLHHARLSDDRELQAQGLTGMQAACFYQGHYDQVLPLVDQERALWASLGRPAAVARCDHHRGVVLATLGRTADAQVALADCVAAFDTLGDREMRVHALRELAVVSAQRGQAAQALQDLQRARALLHELETGAEDWSHLTVQLSRLHRRCAAPAQAQQVLDDFVQRFGDQQAGVVAHVHLERAELMLELGRPHAAWQALALAERCDASDRQHAARLQLLRHELQPAKAAPAADGSGLPNRSLQLALARTAALSLPAGERARRLSQLAAQALDTGLVADALGLQADTTLAWLEAGQADTAAEQARQLAGALAEATPSRYPPQVWWAVSRALPGPPALQAAGSGAGLDHARAAGPADRVCPVVRAAQRQQPAAAAGRGAAAGAGRAGRTHGAPGGRVGLVGRLQPGRHQRPQHTQQLGFEHRLGDEAVHAGFGWHRAVPGPAPRPTAHRSAAVPRAGRHAAGAWPTGRRARACAGPSAPRAPATSPCSAPRARPVRRLRPRARRRPAGAASRPRSAC